jgi:hypothetical protein
MDRDKQLYCLFALLGVLNQDNMALQAGVVS